MKVRTRFAPSPTGYLHIGGLRTALYAWLFAKKHGGSFILRIEDTDQERFVPGAVDVICNTLRETGLYYDEGPGAGGEYGPYVQSERKEIYAQHAQKLIESGNAYYCFCTKERLDALRADAAAQGTAFKYDKHCLKLDKKEINARLGAGEPHVIRQNMPLSGVAGFDDMVFGKIEVDASSLDDPVLIKSDGMPTYNFANVIDDHLMRITHVIRGTEYLSSTPKYNHLYRAFGWEPPAYIHLPPVMKSHGRKLSKREGDASYDDFIKKGYLKEAIINYIALLGWNPGTTQEKFTLKELLDAFSVERISKSPAIFDEAKLAWLNGEYIRSKTPNEFYAIAEPYLNYLPNSMDKRFLSGVLQPRTTVLTEIPEMTDFLAKLPDYDPKLYLNQKQKVDYNIAKTALAESNKVLPSLSRWTIDALHDALIELCVSIGVKKGQLLWPLRIAVTGKSATPGGAAEAAYLLGKSETLRRIDIGLKKLE